MQLETFQPCFVYRHFPTEGGWRDWRKWLSLHLSESVRESGRGREVPRTRRVRQAVLWHQSREVTWNLTSGDKPTLSLSASEIFLQTSPADISHREIFQYQTDIQTDIDRGIYFSIRTVVNSGKICVLNLQPSSLPSIHQSDLKPYVVFLTPPSPQMSKQQANKHGQIFKVNYFHFPGENIYSFFQEDEYRELVSISQSMEELYGQFFDSVIPFEVCSKYLSSLLTWDLFRTLSSCWSSWCTRSACWRGSLSGCLPTGWSISTQYNIEMVGRSRYDYRY